METETFSKVKSAVVLVDDGNWIVRSDGCINDEDESNYNEREIKYDALFNAFWRMGDTLLQWILIVQHLKLPHHPK